jgi:hypothetical protein
MRDSVADAVRLALHRYDNMTLRAVLGSFLVMRSFRDNVVLHSLEDGLDSAPHCQGTSLLGLAIYRVCRVIQYCRVE